jgi:hypothetical protein
MLIAAGVDKSLSPVARLVAAPPAIATESVAPNKTVER